MSQVQHYAKQQNTMYNEEETSPAQIVKLNIGGMKFTTTLSTLHNIPGNMLSVMFSGRHHIVQDEEGYYFIDRDGTHFRHILNLLRFPMEFTIELSQSDMRELEREASFYCLSDALDKVRQDSEWEVTATSAGYSVHITDPSKFRSFFTVNKLESKSGQRGWNIMLLHPRTGETIAHECFDFYENGENAVRQCTAFLKDVAVHTVFLLAIKDEGSLHVTTELIKLLTDFGGKVERVLEWRASFAMIGQKGMRPGAAAEAYHPQGDIVTVSMKFLR